VKTLLRIAIVLVLVCSASDTIAQSPSVLDLFRHDPVSFFAGPSGQMWVGNIRFMLQDYSDTLKLTVDSTGHTLVINRVLVRMIDTTVVSRGFGTITPVPGGATFTAAWIEHGYDEAAGLMQWGDEQWEISFQGEWKQWFINVRKEADTSFTAGLARAVGKFPPVELAEMTYFAIPAKR
jgi:hypothetical protein